MVPLGKMMTISTRQSYPGAKFLELHGPYIHYHIDGEMMVLVLQNRTEEKSCHYEPFEHTGGSLCREQYITSFR
jgi:hypothetical protein